MTPDELTTAVADELAAMRAELRRAMSSAERAERVAVELAATVDTLCEILRVRGQLGPGHVRLLERVREQRRILEERLREMRTMFDELSEVEAGCLEALGEPATKETVRNRSK